MTIVSTKPTAYEKCNWVFKFTMLYTTKTYYCRSHNYKLKFLQPSTYFIYLNKNNYIIFCLPYKHKWSFSKLPLSRSFKLLKQQNTIHSYIYIIYNSNLYPIVYKKYLKKKLTSFTWYALLIIISIYSQ